MQCSAWRSVYLLVERVLGKDSRVGKARVRFEGRVSTDDLDVIESVRI